MVPMHILLLLCIFGANFPPLEASEASRLAFTVDGRDSLDDGFAVLVENVQEWSAESEEKSSSAEPLILSKIVDDPSAYRGEVFTVSGVLEQRSASSPPWEFVEEWFVRDSSGVPFLLYIVGETSVATKMNISANARFYKTIKLTSRDGKARSFATFVTSNLSVSTKRSVGVIPTPLLLVPVVVVGAISVFLLSRKKASRRLRVRDVSLHIDEVIDAVHETSMDLPEDPADALALLHESAEELT